MEWLETAVVVVHILVCVGLVALIMLQQGKGAEAGASFGGGASQTVFGSQGSGTFMTKTTKYFAIVFFVTSMALAIIAKQKSEVAEGIIAPAAVENISGDAGAAVSEEQVELEPVSEDAKAPELE